VEAIHRCYVSEVRVIPDVEDIIS
jgi:hypothetical protein